MKKRLLIFALIAMFTGNVYAASTSMSGSKSINVGSSSKVYVKVNASGGIKGVDIDYDVSGNISVSSVSVGSGLSTMSRNGNRHLLYANEAIPSGSTVLIFNVKGVSEGTGTISVKNVELTVDGATVQASGSSININVKKKITTTKTTTTQSREEKERDEKALSDAKNLVEVAEKSLNVDDYNKALSAVKALKDSSDKDDLLKRLDSVKYDIDVNKAALEKCNSDSDSTVKVCKNTSCTKWIVLCIILFIGLLAESSYLLFKKD